MDVLEVHYHRCPECGRVFKCRDPQVDAWDGEVCDALPTLICDQCLSDDPEPPGYGCDDDPVA